MNESQRLTIPSMRDRVSPEEWQTRLDLAASLVPIAADLVASAQRQASVVTHSLGAKLVWPGLLRLAQSLDRSYES
jgi:hypothetical protein